MLKLSPTTLPILQAVLDADCFCACLDIAWSLYVCLCVFMFVKWVNSRKMAAEQIKMASEGEGRLAWVQGTVY